MSDHDAPTPERDARVAAAKADVARALARHPGLTHAEIIRILTEEAAACARFIIRDERAGRDRPPSRADVSCSCGWSAVTADPDDAFADHLALVTLTHDPQPHRLRAVFLARPQP